MAFVNNLVILEGFVAGAPKRIGDNGPAVGQISVGKRVKDKDTNQYVTKYDFFDLKAWGQTREDFMKKEDGDKIIVSGQLDRESWKDKTTEKNVYKTVVVVNSLGSLPKMASEAPKSKDDTIDWDF